MPRPRVIHDFYGFPDELFAFDYPAPGHPEVAELVAETVKPRWVGLDVDSWGLDHGTWSVLAHMFPERRRPRRAAVDQRAAAPRLPPRHRRPPGTAARRKACSIVGSGNVVHNLRRIDWDQPAGGFDWNRRFDDAATALMRERPGDILKLVEHDDFDLRGARRPTTSSRCSTSPRSRPRRTTTPEVLVDGYAYGSISMTCYTLGADCPEPTGERGRGTAASAGRRAARAIEHLTDETRERGPDGRGH